MARPYFLRYNIEVYHERGYYDDDPGSCILECVEDEQGEWVKWEDVKPYLRPSVTVRDDHG